MLSTKNITCFLGLLLFMFYLVEMCLCLGLHGAAVSDRLVLASNLACAALHSNKYNINFSRQVSWYEVRKV